MKTIKKDLEYYRKNAEEDYMPVPISVLRYISELEEVVKNCCVPLNFKAINKAEFQTKVENLVSQIEYLIDEMPYKGDSERESQKIYLTNQLNQFSYAVNGVEDEDFELEHED